MLVVILQFAILSLSIAIYPLQLYRSYNRYQGVDSAQAVVSDWLFPLLITQSMLWYIYAIQSSEWFILFNSTTNLLCLCGIIYFIKHTDVTILAVAAVVPQQGVTPRRHRMGANVTQCAPHHAYAYAPVQHVPHAWYPDTQQYPPNPYAPPPTNLQTRTCAYTCVCDM